MKIRVFPEDVVRMLADAGMEPTPFWREYQGAWLPMTWDHYNNVMETRRTRVFCQIEQATEGQVLEMKNQIAAQWEQDRRS